MGTETELSAELLAELLTDATKFAQWLIGNDGYADSSLDELNTLAQDEDVIEGLQLTLVDEVGGHEGGGETVERVVKVSRGDEVICYLRFGGYYTSEYGIEWDSTAEFVTPREVVVTQYFNAKELKARETNG